jgi:hypothetical protein
MNKAIKAVSVVAGLLLIMLFVYAILSPWNQGPAGYSSCAATITFSELKQENDNGIYVTEVLEIDEGSCSIQFGLRWAHIDLSLMNDEDLTYYEATGVNIIDNYSGNNTFHWTQEELSFERNLSAQISNDNGTEFPIHIQNEMTGDSEDYNVTGDGNNIQYPRYSLTISVGDKIKIYGSGSDADGPAREGWSLRISHGTGATISEIKIA